MLMLMLACVPWKRAPTPDDGTDPSLHAVLINGGASVEGNYSSHLAHLVETREVLLGRGFSDDNIDIFDSDGGDPGVDQAWTWGTLAGEDLLIGTEFEYLVMEFPTRNSTWEVPRQPATTDALGQWALHHDDLDSDDVLLLYVTDHGSPEGLNLWYETLYHHQLKSLLTSNEARVVVAMNQCFAGGFETALDPHQGQCGLFAVPGDRMSFGCYPILDERTGHAFALVDALMWASTVEEAHAAVSLSDDAPDVPMLSSDLFLERVMEEVEFNGDVHEVPGVAALAERFELEPVHTLDALYRHIEQDKQAMAEAEEAMMDRMDALAAANAWNAQGAPQPPSVDGLPPKDATELLVAHYKQHAIAEGTWPELQGLVADAELAGEAFMARSTREAVRLRQLVLVRRTAVESLPRDLRGDYEAFRECETEPLGTAPSTRPDTLPPLTWRDQAL
jgi:hypothetical protein